MLLFVSSRFREKRDAGWLPPTDTKARVRLSVPCDEHSFFSRCECVSFVRPSLF